MIKGNPLWRTNTFILTCHITSISRVPSHFNNSILLWESHSNCKSGCMYCHQEQESFQSQTSTSSKRKAIHETVYDTPHKEDETHLPQSIQTKTVAVGKDNKKKKKQSHIYKCSDRHYFWNLWNMGQIKHLKEVIFQGQTLVS